MLLSIRDEYFLDAFFTIRIAYDEGADALNIAPRATKRTQIFYRRIRSSHNFFSILPYPDFSHRFQFFRNPASPQCR